jgi:putative transcriptional regulator
MGLPIDGDGPRRGRLLVASPLLADPNFHRTVVLLIEHDDEGAFGVVLNRPGELPVAEVLEGWADQAALVPPAVLFSGGPVSPSAVIGLGRVAGSEPIPDGGSKPGEPGFHRVLGRIGAVDLSRDPVDQAAPIDGARLFSGYAGWGPKQLEGELEQGAWFVLEAFESDVFSAEPDRLWHDVLRRQRGRLAMLASYPPHPSVN